MFTYNERLDDTMLVFSASANEDNADQFLVKLVRRYSKDVHLHLANLGFAPSLRQFATIPWWLGVRSWTDKSDYESLYGMELSTKGQYKVRHKVSQVVKQLHEGGFVHGDIRDMDLLVDRASLAKAVDDVGDPCHRF
jgi:hypothetical protein